MWYNTTTQAMETALETFTKRFTPPGWKTGGGVSIPSLTGAADAFLADVRAAGVRTALDEAPKPAEGGRVAFFSVAR